MTKLKTAINIIKKLNKEGYLAYFVGGYVRDKLMEKDAEEIDIATNAKPEVIEKIFKKTKPVGKEFGVILVIENGYAFEIATFRKDSKTGDGRRPNLVEYSTIEEDSRRRDFTINGMYFDPIKNEIIDLTFGKKDIEKKIIKFIGEPEERIKEDNLRILRAIRFKNTLGFTYEEKTLKAIKSNVELLFNVSAERVRQELVKMFSIGKRGDTLQELLELGVVDILLPEISKMVEVDQPEIYHAEGDVFTHTKMVLNSLPKNTNTEVIWACLLHDTGKPKTKVITDRIHFPCHAGVSRDVAKDILKGLKLPTKSIRKICWLISHHMMLRDIEHMSVGRRNHWFINPNFKDLMQVFKADRKGSRPLNMNTYNEVEKLYKEAIKNLPKKIKPLISGEDVMKILGIKEGKKVGEILKKVREKQLGLEIKNMEEAMNFIETNYSR